MSEDEKRKLADRLEQMGIDVGEWSHEMERRSKQGVPGDELGLEAELMMREVQDAAARISGSKLYNVTLRYERVLADDEEMAIDTAEAGRGHLAHRRAELVYDPEAVSPALESDVEVRAVDSDTSPGDGEAPVESGEFLRVIRELCIDPVTGEVDLPDFALVSHALRDAIVRDRPPEVLDPGPELGFLAFPVSFASHDTLKRASGTDDHVLVFDRRRRSGETVEVWDGPDDDWDEAVKHSVEA